MKKLLANRILLLFGCTSLVLFVAVGFSSLAQYKPWGVPDVRRAEYEAKMVSIEQRNQLIQKFSDQAKPNAVIPSNTYSSGLWHPNDFGSYSFRVLNRGQEPLTLQLTSTKDCECHIKSDIVPPGNQTNVTLVAKTMNPGSKRAFSATISTNDPLLPSKTFKVSGKVREEIIAPLKVNLEPSDPSVPSRNTFVVFSQIHDQIEIVDLSSDLYLFDWNAKPIALDSDELKRFDAQEATTAWIVQVWAAGDSQGLFSGEIALKVAIKQDDSTSKTLSRDIAIEGKVRVPIVFHSPNLDSRDGLDIGTVESGAQRDFHVLVRLRGDRNRQVKVLDVKPDELQATLEPLSKQGDYRLSLIVPEDCPMAVFNSSQRHGYVSIGDPNDRRFSNWFPVNGAVVTASPQ